jgi:multimeric flavodoxin WrbA
MKIVAILGSPHGTHGTTGKLLDAVLKSAERAGAMVVCLPLSDYEVGPCLACDACHKTGTCPVHDHFPELKNALQHADGIVLASPNYMFSVSAQLKALMDRCCGAIHCRAWLDKHAAAVVTSGGPASGEVEQYLVRFLRAMGCWTVGSVGAAAPQLADASAGAFKQAADLGARLVAAIRQHEAYPDQTAERAAMHERMKQLITMRQADWPFEYEYWKSHGWL